MPTLGTTKGKIRAVYGPWTGGINNSDDPVLLEDNKLYEAVNFDFTDKGSLSPRPAFRTLYAAPVADTTQPSLKVLGHDNITYPGAYEVAVCAKITYDGGGSPTGTTFVLVNGAEGNGNIFPSNVITTNVVGPVTASDTGFYQYLYYSDRGYFLNYTGSKSFSCTSLNGNGVTPASTAVPNVPDGGRFAFIFKDRMWVITRTRVYYSKVTDPTTWAAPDGGFFDILSDDHSDTLNAYAILNDTLFLFKKNSTYQFNFTSDPASDGYLRVVSRTRGAINAVTYNGLIFVQVTDGIFNFINGQFIRISSPVDDKGGLTKLYRMGLYEDKLIILLNYVGVGFSAMRFVVYNLTTGTWTTYRVEQATTAFSSSYFDWSFIDLKALVVIEGSGAFIFSTGSYIIAFSSTSSLKYDRTIDAPSTVKIGRPKYEITTKSFTFDDEFNYKKLYNIRFAGEFAYSLLITPVTQFVEQDGVPKPSGTYDYGNRTLILGGSFRFRQIGLVVTWVEDMTIGADEYWWSSWFQTKEAPVLPSEYSYKPYLRALLLNVEVGQLDPGATA